MEPMFCPGCGSVAQHVEVQTVKALLSPRALATFRSGSYWLCTSRTCDVVYFMDHTAPVFRLVDLKVTVGYKEAHDPITLCYCFGYTTNLVRDEYEQTGVSTVVEAITAHIQAKRCACDVNNPTGKCCLAQVDRYVKQLPA